MTKILVVDDEEVLLRMYVYEFTHSGFEVNVARDGGEVFTIIKEFKPDFILLDIMLPSLDGIAVFQRLLSTDATKNIPVGFLSALGKEIADFVGDDKEIIKKAVFFMQKDKYTPKQIASEVRKYLDKKNLLTK